MAILCSYICNRDVLGLASLIAFHTSYNTVTSQKGVEASKEKYKREVNKSINHNPHPTSS